MPKKKTTEPGPARISISSFKIEQAIVEVRAYNRAFMRGVVTDFWDSFERELGVPILYGFQDQASFTKLENGQEVTLDQDKSSVVQHFPRKDLTSFFALCLKTHRIYVEQMRTEKLIRIGFRLIYSIDFDDPIAVTQAFLKLPYIAVPDGLTLAQGGKALMPTYNVGYSDGQKTTVYRLRGNASKLEIDLPPMLAFGDNEYPAKIEKVYNQFIFDADVFTSKPLSPGEILIDEWLNQAYDVVKSDAKCFFPED